MVNLKATVRIKTKSGFYPVYIRFTKKKQTSYIKTAWVVNEKGLSSNNEITDPYVIQQTSSFAIVQRDMQLKRSTYEVLQILSISLTDKTPLRDLFEKTNFNDVKELDYPLFEGLFD